VSRGTASFKNLKFILYMKKNYIINLFTLSIYILLLALFIFVINFILGILILHCFDLMLIFNIFPLNNDVIDTSIEVNNQLQTIQSPLYEQSYLQRLLDLLGNKKGMFNYEPKFNKLYNQHTNLPNITKNINTPLTIKYIDCFYNLNKNLVMKNLALNSQCSELYQKNLLLSKEYLALYETVIDQLNGLLDFIKV
jgi:hypothetical protein